MIRIEDVSKTFVMRLQGDATFEALRDVSLQVERGCCAVLSGPSGAGKSTLLKIVYGNYLCSSGHIFIRDRDEAVDIASAHPRRIIALRRHTLGYVSQFLRVIPRISARDLVAEAARELGVADDIARRRAETLLERLRIPSRLWDLAPATFSGGEQQRVNIARGFAAERPILLLDEPTASLDAANRDVVEELISEHRSRGAAILAVVHDEAMRRRIADRIVEMSGVAHGRRD